MIAKVIAQAPDRAGALAMLADGLEATQIAGCVTNTAFLARLARHAGFAAGDVDTGLIARDLASLAPPPQTLPEAQAVAALAVLGLDRARNGADPFDRIGSWALWELPVHHGELVVDGTQARFGVSFAGRDQWDVALPTGSIRIGLAQDADEITFSAGKGPEPVSIARWPGHVTLFMRGAAHEFAIPDPFRHAGEAGGGDAVAAPMPGLVKIVHVEKGASVSKGGPLLVLEAMKMEHVLVAPRDCVIEAVDVSPGDQVTEGTLLVALLPEAG